MEIVQYVISANDLERICGRMLDSALSRMTEKHTSNEQGEKESVLLSANDVCRIFGVTRNTLWKWNKVGYLRCVKVGRGVFYNSSDVEKLKVNY